MRRQPLAVAGVRGHVRRLVATALAIIIGVAFVTTSMLLLNAVNAGIREAWSQGAEAHDLVLSPGEAELAAGVVDRLRAAEGVEVSAVAASAVGSAQEGRLVVVTTPPLGSGAELLSGRMPAGPGEVAASTSYAQLGPAEVGDSFIFTPDPQAQLGPRQPGEVTVVGIVDLSADPRWSGADALVATEDALRSWLPQVGYQEVRLDLSPGADPATARAEVEAIAADAVVRTGAEHATYRVQGMTGETDFLGAILLGFGAVALATSALVIANTFTIVLTQRSQELALLRCVGATRAQVRRSVIAEASLLGVVAATLGTATGTFLAWLAGQGAGTVDLGTPMTLTLTPSMPALLLPWLVGVLITLGAAWWPTLRATRVAPVAALAHQPAAPVRSRAGAARVAVSVLLLVLGGAALVAAVLLRSVPVGIVGGLVSFVGVLLAAVFVVPALLRVLGSPGRLAGVPGRLAVGNAVSNPARAAATSAALLIGVTLITMTSVGAASAERTALAEIDDALPVDVMLTTAPDWSDDGPAMVPLDPEIAAEVAALGSVSASTPLRGAGLTLGTDTDAGFTEVVYSLDPASAAPVLRESGMAQRLAPGTFGMGANALTAYGLEPGETIRVSGPGGSVDAVVVVFALDWAPVVAPDVMARVASDAPLVGLLARLHDDAPVGAAMTDIRALSQEQDVWLSGTAPMRESVTGMLDVLVLITTGLLGVAVLIAVIGIANTLSLSVLERGRENSLLRALGLTRGQLRGTLAVEGMLLALASAVLGLGLGIGYAWFGVQSLLPADMSAQLDLPWARLGLVVLVAVLAGLAASVLPARRAVRATPAQGLALP